MAPSLIVLIIAQSCILGSYASQRGHFIKSAQFGLEKAKWFRATSAECLNNNAHRHKRESARGSYQQHIHRWNSTLLTYKIHGNPASLDTNKTRLAIYKAFRVWAKRTDFVFYESDGKVDINIRFLSGFHGDGENQAFDGAGGHLAHALYPPEGEIHFDADEWWAVSANRRTAARGFYRNVTLHPYSLVHVAAHEIGHALGLPHSKYEKSLMFPLYQKNQNRYRSRVKVHKTDLKQLSFIYNDDKHKQVTLKNTKPKLQLLFLQMKDNPNRYTSLLPPEYYGEIRKAPPIPDPCDCNIDASFDDGEKIYLFSGRYFWTVNTAENKTNPPTKILHKWRLSKPRVNAATHSTFSDRTYLFSGQKYWRLYKGTIEPGYPRFAKNRGLPSSPDAAICIPETPKMLIFKGSRYYEFHELMEKVPHVTPKWTSKLNAELLPRSNDANFAMFMQPSGVLHIIRGREVIKLCNFDGSKPTTHQYESCKDEKYALFGKESPLNCIYNEF